MPEGPEPSAVYDGDDTLAETMAIEQRLLAGGLGMLPDVLRSAGDFDFEGTTVEEVLAEAQRYLEHQYTVDLAGARVLAAIGEAAVKAQAFDAIMKLARR